MLIDQYWYEKNKDNVSQEEIDALGIELSIEGRKYPELHQGDRKGDVKNLVRAIESI